MPEDKDKTQDENLSEEATSPDDDNRATETSENSSEDVGELKQKLEKAEAKIKEHEENRSNWEKSQHKKGLELNIKLREVDNTLDSLKKMRAELERSLNQAKTQTDISSIEDPIDRLNARIDLLEKEKNELKKENEVAKREKEHINKMNYWQDIMDNALNKHGKDMDDVQMLDLEEKMKAKMGRIPWSQWEEEHFDEAARISRDEILHRDKITIDKYTTKKKKDKEDTTVSSGTATPPKLRNLADAKDQHERIRWMLENMGKSG